MINSLSQRSFETGHMTYIIYSLLAAKVRYYADAGYDLLSLTRASATDASDEFYRRIMGPHEDRAIDRNGDISVIPKS